MLWKWELSRDCRDSPGLEVNTNAYTHTLLHLHMVVRGSTQILWPACKTVGGMFLDTMTEPDLTPKEASRINRALL